MTGSDLFLVSNILIKMGVIRVMTWAGEKGGGLCMLWLVCGRGMRGTMCVVTSVWKRDEGKEGIYVW